VSLERLEGYQVDDITMRREREVRPGSRRDYGLLELKSILMNVCNVSASQ
jgi:hypothetical protein